MVVVVVVGTAAEIDAMLLRCASLAVVVPARQPIHPLENYHPKKININRAVVQRNERDAIHILVKRSKFKV